LGELLDITVIGTAGILWNSELSTKEANIQVSGLHPVQKHPRDWIGPFAFRYWLIII
jgi:hypothetical protein